MSCLVVSAEILEVETFHGVKRLDKKEAPFIDDVKYPLCHEGVMSLCE